MMIDSRTYRSGSDEKRAHFGWVVFLFCGLVAFSSSPVSAQLLPALGNERSGTSGFQFLKIPVDARAAALGESVVASASDASTLFWNPALVSLMDGLQVGFYHTAYFVDVNLEFVALSYPLPGSNITVGASLQTLNSGEMDVTTEFQPFGTGQTFRLTDIAAGLTISQRLTDLFSYGITSKYVRENVAGISSSTVVFDMGIYYQIGTTGAKMAVSVRNFGFDGRPKGSIDRIVIADNPIKTETDFEGITPPTTFHLGTVYEVLRDNPNNSLLVSAQLNNPSDNSENFNMGLEYGWHNTIVFRVGYRFGVEEFTIPSLGVGLHIPYLGSNYRIDYAFNQLERLGNVHRFGLNLSF
ncbi:MAG: type IX secretion system outer membrane channel protein PorV [Rhodothermia bacterium]|nr:MAG: type IX secretion system outer membrane channel protein PorV [Rhodothermia bacterium]